MTWLCRDSLTHGSRVFSMKGTQESVDPLLAPQTLNVHDDDHDNVTWLCRDGDEEV